MEIVCSTRQREHSIHKRTIAAATLGAAAVVAATARGLARRFAVVDQSMRPALEHGDWLIARRCGEPARGDVVVFSIEPDVYLIKRVIGLPGEHIAISDGQVHVDGQALAEPWANGPSFPDADDQIPEDAVWVLGDNRALSSADSRTMGPVAIEDIDWKAVAVYWPSARAGMV